MTAALQLSSKFVATYNSLFQGRSPVKDDLYTDLFVLDVNRDFLAGKLNRIPKETCLGALKVLCCFIGCNKCNLTS